MNAGKGSTAGIGIAILLALELFASCNRHETRNASPAGRLPAISPDYTGITIPPNIAPLNFTVAEAGDRYLATIRSEKGADISVRSASPEISIPARKWKRLLRENRGKPLYIDMCVRCNGRWLRFDAIRIDIATEDIDRYLTYREAYPQFYKKLLLRVCQRDLESFGERCIVSPKEGCFNCHTFYRHKTDQFLLQCRFYEKNYMLMNRHGALSLIGPGLRKPGSVWAAWHPSGKLLALVTDVDMFVWPYLSGTGAEENMEFTDMDSDLAIYNIETNTISTTRSISQLKVLETHPAWSPDGKYLYFISCPRAAKEEFEKIKYDLKRIAYDIATDTWGEVETLVAAEKTGLSCTFPAVSPDGKYLLFSMADHGSFPILRRSGDIYLMEIEKKTYRKLDINSDRSDSYHAWSSNGRWIVFTSKRNDGIVAKLFFSYFDTGGVAHKPFILPQRNPRFYETQTRSFHRAEFTTEPIDVSLYDLNATISDTSKIVGTVLDKKIDAISSPTQRTAPWSDRDIQ